jgi:hypothetical protein
VHRYRHDRTEREIRERLLQGGALLGLDMALADSCGHESHRRTQQYRSDDNQRQEQG